MPLLNGADIDGVIDGLRVNGVEVAPLVEAELDRMYPERTKSRPSTPDGIAYRVGNRGGVLGADDGAGGVTAGRMICTGRSTGSGRSSRHCGIW